MHSFAHRPLSTFRVVGLALLVLIFLLFQAITAASPLQLGSPELSRMLSAYVLIAAVSLGSIVLATPWGPLGVPLLYMATVVFLPPIYVLQRDESLFLLKPANVTMQPIGIASLVFSSYIVGALIVGLLSGTRKKSSPGKGSDAQASRWIYRAGCLLVIGSVAAKLYFMVATAGEAYGANQFSGALPVRMNQMSTIAAIVGAALLMFANVQISGRILGRFAATCLTVSCALALASGGRFQVLVVLVMILMMKWRYVGFVRPWLVPLGGIAVLLLFSMISQARLDPSATRDLSGNPVVFTTLTDFSSVFLSISLTGDYAGQGKPFLNGSTYLAAIPGIETLYAVAGGNLTVEPGALAFRTLIGMNDPNLGLGFSLPAEAYLNFGNAGVAVFFGLFGGLLAVLYRRFVDGRNVAQGFSYILLVACLPYTFRADALSLLNLWIYPVVLISLVQLAAARRWRGGPIHGTGTQQAYVSTAGRMPLL